MKRTEELINEALASYGMGEASYELLRQNENIVCKVEFEGKKYVLRIHRPIEGFQISLITEGKNDIELFKSEASLLEYMSAKGFDGLQKPSENTSGEYITVLDGNIPVMLLSWVEGEDIKHEDGSKYAYEMGRLACKIRKATEGFSGDRIRYDNEICDRIIKELKKAADCGHLSKENADVCIREANAIKRAQNRLIQTDGECLIHGDLGLYNVLVNENELIPIDFSLSGYGCLAQEAGMHMSQLHDEESYSKLLKGYADGGFPVAREDAEIFLAYNLLLFICARHKDVYREEWFAGALKSWCEELFVHKG